MINLTAYCIDYVKCFYLHVFYRFQFLVQKSQSQAIKHNMSIIIITYIYNLLSILGIVLYEFLLCVVLVFELHNYVYIGITQAID